MKTQLTLPALILLNLVATSVFAAENGVLALRSGQILTISGEPITDGVIVIKGGKIIDVGTDVSIPEGATTLDVSNKVIMPGLVSAGPVPAVRGDLNEQSSEITPAFRISTGLDPASKRIKQILQTGVTTVHVAPGQSNLIAGLGTVIKPHGKTAADMIIKEDASLWITLGSLSTYGNRPPRRSKPDDFYYRRPTTRMAVAWMLRKSFFDARQYTAAKPDIADDEMEILVSAMSGKIPVYVSARRTTDIRMALNIAREYNLSINFFQCTEGYKMADQIAAANIPVIIEPCFYISNRRTYGEDQNINWNNAGILSSAGVKVALASHAGHENNDLLTTAVFAARHGMSGDQALRAVTLTPAEILGVADRLGSIEKGKDADLLVLSGHPLAGTSCIEQVIINGKTVYQADKGE